METESFGQKAKRTTKRVVRIIIIVIVLAAAGYFSFTYWGIYDEGVRAGFILKISKRGMLFKTYEGQLNLETFGSLKNASPIAGTFDFSVEGNNEKVITDLEAVALSGERVNLKYIRRYVSYPWRGETKYFVREVERLK